MLYIKLVDSVCSHHDSAPHAPQINTPATSGSLTPIFGTAGGQPSCRGLQNSVYYVELASTIRPYNPVLARLELYRYT